MSLHLTASLAERGFDLTLDLADGERLAILGANGAGKSTLLALLAGTLAPDAGRAELAGRVLFDLAAGAWLPPHARGVALLAQDALLFPHLSVVENVEFGPRATRIGRAAARERAEHWLSEVGAAELAGRRPSELSGGEAQRVAIARALATEPALLLLDEPMAALDVSVAPALRRVLRRVLADRTTVLVTHDPLDALLLSDRVLVLVDGRVVEQGPTGLVLQQPRDRFTAGLAGLNLLRGSAAAGGLLTDSGFVLHGVAAEPLSPGEPAAAAFSPTAVSIYLVPPQGSPRNLLPVTVAELEPRGGIVRVRADDHRGDVIAADVTVQAAAELDLYPGREVVFSLKATAVALYPG